MVLFSQLQKKELGNNIWNEINTSLREKFVLNLKKFKTRVMKNNGNVKAKSMEIREEDSWGNNFISLPWKLGKQG